MADVREILELELPPAPEISKEAIIGGTTNKKKPLKKVVDVLKRPEGMHRELFALLYSDSKDAPSLLPSETAGQGYKQMKAKLGMRRVRPWKWMPFTNPARKDGAVLHHWRRAADEGKDYPFAKFNKQVHVPSYTDLEYQQHLHTEGWTRQETDHLFDLCARLDLRFIVIHDRWDRTRFAERTVENLKERFYDVCNILVKIRSAPPVRMPHGHEPKIWVFDADHEKRRKEQLRRLFDRTPEQVEEEQMLINELRKIEARKKEREKKTQDLQKLISQADNSADSRKGDKKCMKKKLQHPARARGEGAIGIIETAGIKFPDFKASGVTLRSQRIKLPASVGQKKTKAIEQLLQELGIELNPMPTEEICTHFNELRSDMVLLYELKLALATCEFELQTLRHQYEALAPGKTLDIPLSLSTSKASRPAAGKDGSESPSKPKAISEIIDVVGTPGTPNRKRKAALEQSNVLKKIKNRTYQ